MDAGEKLNMGSRRSFNRRKTFISVVGGAILKKLAICIAILLIATVAFASLKFKGSGAAITFDPSGFPPEFQEKYKLMDVKCTNATCHSMERTVVAIRDGITPITKSPFDKEAAKAYGVKMMRRPDSGIGKNEAKTIVEMLYYLIDERGK